MNDSLNAIYSKMSPLLNIVCEQWAFHCLLWIWKSNVAFIAIQTNLKIIFSFVRIHFMQIKFMNVINHHISNLLTSGLNEHTQTFGIEWWKLIGLIRTLNWLRSSKLSLETKEMKNIHMPNNINCNFYFLTVRSTL